MEQSTPSPGPHQDPRKGHHHVLVAVVTTSGRCPTKGFDKFEEDEPVEVALKKAVHALGIVSANDWLATADGRDLNPTQSYVEQGLAGEVTIHYGPRAGGGGSRA